MTTGVNPLKTIERQQVRGAHRMSPRRPETGKNRLPTQVVSPLGRKSRENNPSLFLPPTIGQRKINLLKSQLIKTPSSHLL